MAFTRSMQRYGKTPVAETPFQRAGQVWDDRIGAARVQARNWRLIAFGMVGLSALLAGGEIWQARQSRIVPYVVEVDRLGEPRAVSPADARFRPTDPQIAWGLARFVEDIRTVSLDPVLMRQQWLRGYDFVTQRGALFLGDYARRADPFGHIGEETTSVEVTSVTRASDHSFEIKWTETSYARGARTNVAHWTAFVTIAMKPPVSADTLRRNPLGLYVDGIDWSREIEPPAALAVPAADAPAAAAPPAPASSDSPVPEEIAS